MIITHYGLGAIKAQFGDTTLVFGPVSKDSKNGKPTRQSSTVGLISVNHRDSNGQDGLHYGDKTAFIIDGPGEYEVADVFVKGVPSQSEYDKHPRINTIYVTTLEGMRIAYLGALSSEELEAKSREALEDVDILFVPISGEGVLDPVGAYKFAVKIGARLIIPIYTTPATLKDFLKEAGGDKVKAEDKLTIKKKDVGMMEGEVAVLNAQ